MKKMPGPLMPESLPARSTTACSHCFAIFSEYPRNTASRTSSTVGTGIRVTAKTSAAARQQSTKRARLIGFMRRSLRRNLRPSARTISCEARRGHLAAAACGWSNDCGECGRAAPDAPAPMRFAGLRSERGACLAKCNRLHAGWMAPMQHPAVDGATRLYGIIGDPIAQVKSPAVFNEKFRGLGKNAVLVPLHVRPERFDESLRGLKSLANLDGMLVTIPFKSRVLAHVDFVLPAARRIGAVNALRRDADGRWSGEMFDGAGCLLGMRASGLDPKGRSIMLLGAGGAGSAVADALAEAGAASIAIFDLVESKSTALAEKVGRSHPGCRVLARPPTLAGIDVLVNATPVGMAPGD